jgi:hypothetical protein
MFSSGLSVELIIRYHNRRFFRIHCKYIATQNRNPRLYRSRSSFINNISSPVAAFNQEEPVTHQENSGEDDRSEIQVIDPTPVATKEIPGRSEETNNPSKETHVLNDVQTFSSSPRVMSVRLPSINETQNSPVVTTGISSSRAPAPHSNAKSMTCGRLSSLTLLPTSFLTSHIVPRKNTTTFEVNNISDIPGSRTQKYQGYATDSGGPVDLLRRVIKHAAPDTYRKVERKMTMPTETRLEASSVPWLNFSGLVVGRNSDFHTDTLTTEQVKDIGGTEYRALRLLSYLVPAVRLFTDIFFFFFFQSCDS